MILEVTETEVRLIKSLLKKELTHVKTQVKLGKIFDLQNKLNELTIRGVSGSSFTKDDLKKAFNSGRTLKNYKGEWVDNELMMDDHTDGKYSDFEDWFENYR